MLSRLNKVYQAFPALGEYSAVPAAMIDKTYVQDSSWTWIGIKAHFIYLTLFTPAVVVDTAAALGLSVGYAASTFITTDELQDRLLAQQKKYTNLFSKSALATIGTLPGIIIGPKLVQPLFVPHKPPKGIKSGGGHQHAPDARIEYPETVEKLQAIVREASAKGHKIMPVGAGFSQGKQFIPQGTAREEAVVVDLRHLNTIQINSDDKVATVGAGVRWIDLQLQADKHRLALQTMQASNVFSVGGSIGTNIHGWNIRSGVLSNTLVSIDIINASGEKQTLKPEDRLFHHVCGGLGLFGIVVSAKIKLTDNVLQKEIGTQVRMGDYVKHFREKVQPNPNITMHLFRLSLDKNDLLGSGIAVDYLTSDNPQPVTTPDLTPENLHGTRLNRISVTLANMSPYLRSRYWDNECKRLLANNSPPLTTNAIMQPPINAMFNGSVSEAEWLQEYFLPEETLREFVQALGRILTTNQVALINASVRFVIKHEKSPFSYAHDGDRFAVVLCWNQSLRPSDLVIAEKWLREAQEAAIHFQGTYYLPYQHVSNPDHFHAAYPHAMSAMELKRLVDPHELFVSGFYQRYLAAQAPKVNYFNVIMKTDARQRFKGFLEVILQRIETKKIYGLLDDVMRYKDSHAEIYAEFSRRIAEISPSALSTLRRIMQSLRTITDDLAQQAHLLLEGMKDINGLVEIGYPGRFIEGFQKNFKLTGKIVAVNDAERLSDYIQCGFPRPYHQFAKLDYSDPDLHTLADNSADVITCYVGLHHFPENKVDYFMQELRRVLRPGGKFLLMDHDVVNDVDMAMAWGAHMFYNAVMGETLDNEMNETRHFHSIDYWSRLLEKHGLGYTVHGADVPMIRPGDPSRNRMVCFTNKPKLELVQDAGRRDNQALLPPAPVRVSSSRDALFGAEQGSAVNNQPAAESRDVARIKAGI